MPRDFGDQAVGGAAITQMMTITTSSECARLRALGYSIYTEAETLEELKAMIRDAVECHFEAEAKPRVIRLHWVKDEVIPV